MDAGEPFTLSDEQRQRLLALRAAWEEGEDEERLERLRLREEDAETVRAFRLLLEEADFAAGHDLNYAQMTRLLALARALAPNPNLDARLLRRPNEPEAMSHDLRELLFGKGSPPNRLRGFLSRRHAGGQTAMQLLCAHQPETWPLVTTSGLRALQLSPEQTRQAAQAARTRFNLPAEVAGIESYSNRPVHVGVPDNDPILRLLGDVIVYEAVCDTLQAPDYLTVHRLLTRGMAMRTGCGRRGAASLLYSPVNAGGGEGERGRGGEDAPVPYSRSSAPDYLTSAFVREPERPGYGAADGMNAPDARTPLVPPPDIAGYTQNELLATLEREIAAQGFTYAPLTLRDYYLCLQSKPFVLLSGLSGTGKTRLTSLFAQALTGQADAQYRLLPARPDWADSSAIVGYVNLLAQDRHGRGTFVSTPFLDFLHLAARTENAHRAFFLCLDEMNLARVEHYFAEVLSAMETDTREILLPDGRIIRLPANLFLTGTLNLDEATHSLSRKVLDRANTLTFGDVCMREEPAKDAQAEQKTSPGGAVTDDMGAERGEQNGILPYAVRQALFLQARVGDVGAARRRLRQVSTPGADFAVQVVNTLADINGLLEPHGLQFAYRVRDEALRYCANSFDVDGRGLLTPDLLDTLDTPGQRTRNLQIALDFQLLQKVLPRLTGTLELLETPLAELLRYAEKNHYAQTARRLQRMRARLQRDGFVGFDAV